MKSLTKGFLHFWIQPFALILQRSLKMQTFCIYLKENKSNLTTIRFALILILLTPAPKISACNTYSQLLLTLHFEAQLSFTKTHFGKNNNINNLSNFGIDVGSFSWTNKLLIMLHIICHTLESSASWETLTDYNRTILSCKKYVNMQQMSTA